MTIFGEPCGRSIEAFFDGSVLHAQLVLCLRHVVLEAMQRVACYGCENVHPLRQQVGAVDGEFQKRGE